MQDEILSEVICTTEDGFEQVRLTVNEFRDSQYLHVRKYYLDFDEQWHPTKQGVAIPITITNISKFFNALTKLLAQSDVLHIILENSDDEIQELIHESILRKLTGASE